MAGEPACTVQGTCDERFDRVKHVLERHLATGRDTGMSFALFIDGKPIVDAWGGYMDAARTRPWQQDTIINVFSITKIPAALCIHLLVDRGKIDLDAPVATYWPEFARAGKAGVLVRHVLCHTSGVSYFQDPVTAKDLYDWDRMVRMIESEPPLWEPGTRVGYQMVTFSFLTGELVRRVSGKSIGKFFKDEFSIPLGIDFHIGTPDEFEPRIATMIPPSRLSSLERLQASKVLKHVLPKIAVKVVTNPFLPREAFTSREWRLAELPSSNGHGNARAIARTGSIIACGGELDGKRLLSKVAVARSLEVQIEGKDLVTMAKVRMALGWGLKEFKTASGTPHAYYSWGGLGGSICVMDPAHATSFAFTPNKLHLSMLGDRRLDALLNTVYECIDSS